jgi:hypothetical protein
MDVKTHIQKLLNFASLCFQEEKSSYKSALLLRIQTNAKAINHLIDGGFWIEAPVLVRVSFEHICRLYLYIQ